MDPVEQWARATLQVVEVDSLAWTYSGEGPPSWRMPRPEIERDLDPHDPGDWWFRMCLADIRSIAGRDARVLDVGCGPGWPCVALAPYVGEIVAMDASPLAISMLRRAVQARNVGNVHVRQADAASLPLDDNSFDAVVASDVIDVVRDPTCVAEEVFRVLKPGGRFVSWVQNFRCVLGCAERCSRSFDVAQRQAIYTYHRASLSPAHSVDLRFRMDLGAAVPPVAGVPHGTRDIDAETALAELQQLRPAMGREVELYRTLEFTPETAHEPFAAAGFSDLAVLPLNHDVCCAFATELVRRDALPRDPEDLHALSSALLSVMPHTDPDRSWQMSVKGRKPEGTRRTATGSP